jgi:hypothetical protein
MAVNATVAGVWAAGLLALLVFFLNSGVSLKPRTYWPLAASVMLFYAPASGVGWALLAGAVRLFATFRGRIPWLGFRPVWRFLMADLCLLAGLYVYNLREARDYLPAAMRTHLQGATLLLVVAAAILAADALRRGWRRRRLRAIPLTVAALLLTAGLFGIRERYRHVTPPLSASEIEPPPPRAGLLFLGIDGAAPDEFFSMVADGRLPRFRELTQTGSSAPLSAPQPPRKSPTWATVLSGLEPASHGAVNDIAYSPRGDWPEFRLEPAGVGFRALETVGLLAFRDSGPLPPAGETLDRILSRCGYDVLTAGWEGVIEPQQELLGTDAGSELVLPDVVGVHEEALRRHLAAARADPEGAPLAAGLEEALRRDLTIGRRLLAAMEAPAAQPRAVLARFPGLDGAAHLFLRYQRPDRFGNVTDRELDRYGQVMADYYRFVDAWLGVLRDHLGPQVLSVVVSPYGLEPVGLRTRLLNALTGRWYVSGTHRDAGPGFVLAAGPGFREGGRLERAGVEDVLPTLLYLLDLPVGRDMDGQPLPRFASSQFAERHAISAVPSWRTVTVVRSGAVW